MALWGDQPVSRLWRPVAVGALARLREEQRQVVWNDSAYTEENYYALEIRGPRGPTSTQGNQIGPPMFVFPLGPQSVRKSTRYRQTLTPTLGGLVSEERGVAWVDITISGNFGLAPKFGYDSTTESALAGDKPNIAWDSPVSGPLWTRKMIANIFDRYAAMKARADENSQTVLVWHNFKDDEHWIVVPKMVDLERNVSSRLMYPFTIQLQAIARTTPTPLRPVPRTFASVVANTQNAIRVARAAVDVFSSARDTLTSVASQIRYVVAQIDSIIDSAAQGQRAVTAFIELGQRTSDIAGAAVASARQIAELAANLEGIREFPAARDQLNKLVDTYDSLQACAEFQTSATAAESTANAESNQDSGAPADPGDPTVTGTYASQARAGLTGTKRTYSQRDGWAPHTVSAGETLESIALEELGSADQWYEIAVLNELRAPYISWAGLPGTATIGSTILIPKSIPTRKTAAATDSASASPEALYGTDMLLYEPAASMVGRPVVDLRINPRTTKDVATIAGVSNLVQATQMRLWTERGAYTLDPGYGMPAPIGYPNTEANVVAIRQAAASTLASDSRIRTIQSMTITQIDDTVDVDATVLPVASSEGLPLSISLT